MWIDVNFEFHRYWRSTRVSVCDLLFQTRKRFSFLKKFEFQMSIENALDLSTIDLRSLNFIRIKFFRLFGGTGKM